ncbi:MAG: VCBS repeat-containing protein, partial [bacterium]
TVTDDMTGVFVASTQLKLAPLIGTQSIQFWNLTRVSGDELNGVYTGTATLPQGSKVGVWAIDPLTLTDQIGNSRGLIAEDMIELFPESENLTVANTAQAESVIIEKQWNFSSGLASVTFPENTVVTKQEGGSFAFYKMVNQGFSVGTLTDDGLLGNPVQTIRIGIPGLNLDFSQNVTVSLNVGDEYEGISLLIQSLDEDGLAWANETECTVTYGLCNFTVDHATYLTANAQPYRYIVAGTKADGGPQVTAWNPQGEIQVNIMAYLPEFRGGVRAVMADVNGLGADEIVTVPYSAGGPHVRIFKQNGQVLANVFPYALAFRGGLSLDTGDVDGDGIDEIIVAPTSGGGPQVRVYKYSNGNLNLYASFFAYPEGLRSGLKVFAGDVNGDGRDEIVTATKAGATPHVRTFDGQGNVLGQFFAFPLAYRGGVNVTLADYNGDSSDEIVVTPAAMGGPQYRVLKFDGTLIKQAFAYNQNWRLGLVSGVGDVDGDNEMEIILAPSNGGPHIQVFGPDGLEHQFMAYDPAFRGGLEIAVADLDLNGQAEIITVPMSAGGPHVRVFNGSGEVSAQFMSHHPAFRGGVNLSVSR